MQSAKTYNQTKGQQQQNWKNDKNKNNKIGNNQHEPKDNIPQSRNVPQTNATENNMTAGNSEGNQIPNKNDHNNGTRYQNKGKKKRLTPCQNGAYCDWMEKCDFYHEPDTVFYKKLTNDLACNESNEQMD